MTAGYIIDERGNRNSRECGREVYLRYLPFTDASGSTFGEMLVRVRLGGGGW